MTKIIIHSFVVIVVILKEVHSDKFCGSSLEDAQIKCWQPCTTDEDCRACALDYACYETGSSCGSIVTIKRGQIIIFAGYLGVMQPTNVEHLAQMEVLIS